MNRPGAVGGSGPGLRLSTNTQEPCWVGSGGWRGLQGVPFPLPPQGRAKEGDAESMAGQTLEHSCPPPLPLVPLLCL